MAVRVELVSPYGHLLFGSRVIKNGTRGWTTGASEKGKPMVKFGRVNSRSAPVPVPQHWIKYAPRRARS